MSRLIRTEPSPVLSKAVEYHGFVFTQGFVTSNPDLDFAGQARDVLAQIDALLELHGTDNTRILQAQIWFKNLGDRAVFNEIWSAWLAEGQAPARAAIQAELADPRWLIEVMLIACK
jgi:enamine deaminase RidA (YjgF/YER057c/UK114 family)